MGVFEFSSPEAFPFLLTSGLSFSSLGGYGALSKSQVTKPCKYAVAPLPETDRIRLASGANVSCPRRHSLPKFPEREVIAEELVVMSIRISLGFLLECRKTNHPPRSSLIHT